jgi:NADPH:quinone reductase-like Zn-dependent oxidoreductase
MSNGPMTMRAVGWRTRGSDADPQPIDVDAPVPGRGELRVHVAWSAVNPADLKVSRGEMLSRLLHARVSPLVVGYDFSGWVERSGEGVDNFKAGDEVFGFLPYAGSTRQGAFAELVTVGQGAVGRKPAGVSHEHAAAAATAGATALQSLRDLGRARDGSRVLVVGAAGGVGSLAVGVAKRLGARVVAVCSTHAVDFVRELGADEVVDRRKQDPLAVPGPFDVVFDAAAAYGYFAWRPKLAPAGAYVTTLPSPGVFVGKIAAAFTARRSEFVVVKAIPKDLERVASWISDGMRVPIDSRFPVRELPSALSRLAKGSVLGRISVQVEGGF